MSLPRLNSVRKRRRKEKQQNKRASPVPRSQSGLCIGTSFQREEGGTSWWKRLTDSPRPGDQGQHHVDSGDPRYDATRTALYLHGLPSKPPQPRSNHGEPQTIQTGRPAKSGTSPPENCRGHHQQGQSEKRPQPRGASGDARAQGHVESWVGSWDRKRTLRKS